MKELQLVDQLNDALQQLKNTFVGKDDIIDLMGICLAGRENLFLLGPPGTAKSALVRGLSNMLDGHTFEYLLTRFTEPNELFGPFDIRKLKDGELVTNTEGMLPEASFIFLDELLNANSAILNSLLMVLNERVFRRGRETRALPALMIVGASNQLPEDEALQALYDRFLLRATCENVDPAQLGDVLHAGWKMEQLTAATANIINPADIKQLQQMASLVNLDNIRPSYITLIQQLRNAGLLISDRRAVKLQRVIAASALLCKRLVAVPSDMWVLRYIWDTTEQQEIIAGIVNAMVAADEIAVAQHPRANATNTPDADEIYKELLQMTAQWDDAEVSDAEKSAIKDRLRYLNGRCEWIHNPTQREYVMQPVTALWKKILQEK
ncbi:MAG: AAA family ATPase [Chitinophaga sp.]|uniref:AAA family ATPase n=1 Tax=Chitinophaga sp. TaxID=1869181 RepID=UPI001B2E1A72|nr:AAA family ATPase [Chitinophaga sp.]MBO9732258.1 AAA family ATPase [Chitinophaga sp.]